MVSKWPSVGGGRPAESQTAVTMENFASRPQQLPGHHPQSQTACLLHRAGSADLAQGMASW